MAFIRLVAALIGFVFGFFLGASLLQVTQVTPANNQVLVVLLLATACAILGWLGAPYVTVMPAAIIVARIRAASAGDLIGGAFGAAIGLMLALFLAFPLSFLPGEIGRYAPLVTAVVQFPQPRSAHHLLRDGGKGCLLGFVTPMHGDKARGHGIEIEWD